ncbi:MULTISPECIES: FAD-dependent oxidoreductase [Heyndrickxia]|jgi:3-oxosteroid 1-dehydrogenase|uniref:FAD-dependent oxidoreductase n=1 Tax=Heyndrickxia TaxID=2837504 RepID=UPI0024313766|nr:FAD-dependent oxidoreductase [Heyndrickxia oleronia]MCI1590925.1 FAD-dependent oxidoreductase [Heyndrickxia oleronia]MCI1612948.1 FAD-dependent oxidoreductase [Heyndrickxia oleronia]MCI1744174.1 FAD-dependent oxidoreductase [Heyndrickxia oleronia]MCI1760785.1 FAD-dependent oxidoreductase [Heyndrickxia oleronia]
MDKHWDFCFDVVVVGSGAGGLTAALTAKLQGLSAIVVEKTELFGGSTSKSGGTVWVPNNFYLEEAGVGDSYEQASAYLNATVGDRVPQYLKDTYLVRGPEMIKYLHENTEHVRWEYTPGYSDYYPELPGGKPSGRAIEAQLFNLRKLGKDEKNMRKSGLPTKGMVLKSSEFHKVNMITRTWIGKKTSLKVGMRLIRTKLSSYNPATLGEALVARLYASLKEAGGEVWLSTPFHDLVFENNRVTGIIAEHNGRKINIEARHGVVFASGGFSHNQELREKYLPQPSNTEWTLSSEGQTGDVIGASRKLGAKLDLMDKMWGTPTSIPPGSPAFMPVAERATPGLIIVNSEGERYLNESVPYHEFVDKMYQNNQGGATTIPSWMIFDQTVKKRYLVFGIMPGQSFPKTWFETGYTKKAETPEDLAKEIGVPPKKLAATIARFNKFAKDGHDQDFQRGVSAYDRYYGDPTLKNPNLAPLEKPPFYAIPIYPGDIGTKGGLVTDNLARVLHENGQHIQGLYATGNCAAAVMGETYPGPGATIGPAMVFGYIAASEMAAVAARPIEA